jgi:hypothetical protein
MERNKTISAMDLLRNEDNDYKVIIVGDGEMAPSELTWVNGAIDYWYYNDKPGIAWLQLFKDKFKNIVWLNPIPARSWNYIQTIRTIRGIFPMFELTLDGLDESVKYLISGKCELYHV